MSDPFVGEIRMFGGNFAPVGWALCNGQIVPISQNTALFSLLGTQYGGNGTSTFALPNLQGLTPMHQGQGPGLTPRTMGDQGGVETVTLTQQQLPAHTHLPQATIGAGNRQSPAGANWSSIRGRLYGTTAGVTMATGALSSTGGSQPHNNVAPYLAVTFIIALNGIFPARN